MSAAYIVGPALGFCNAYGAGLSDWNLLTTYGKVINLLEACQRDDTSSFLQRCWCFKEILASHTSHLSETTDSLL